MASPPPAAPTTGLPSYSASLSLVSSSGAMIPAMPAMPLAVTTTEALQALTAAITGLQLQMSAINH